MVDLGAYFKFSNNLNFNVKIIINQPNFCDGCTIVMGWYLTHYFLYLKQQYTHTSMDYPCHIICFGSIGEDFNANIDIISWFSLL